MKFSYLKLLGGIKNTLFIVQCTMFPENWAINDLISENIFFSFFRKHLTKVIKSGRLVGQKYSI